ncbi:hypothetical protein [Maribacter cobaltidurans]|uniref:Uncharacterized protein n=1 Tax=Maribacter cobaltidurans TaxID=1178778 RepID=A0A223V258_9FLAO|nr:hypothetical protein [Maribacter cobaltidurans]ASV29327.1 hypothetical protein CJ263_03325 [Maribacter cobaltidurans]GGD69969.1 hypothetical protein GCM10011412_04440 [Maribacter cobaltidurans]
MKSIKTIIILFSIILLTQCRQEENATFKITTNRVGNLEKESLARDLDLIYAKDSIVRDTIKSNFGSGSSKIKIYEKGGPLLLTLTPNSDSIPTIQNVLINDKRFTTDKGINIESTFKDIQEKYEIKKIITSINNVVILLKDSDIYFTIDKAELPENLRYKANTNIEAVQIPDAAKIKYMMVGWD